MGNGSNSPEEIDQGAKAEASRVAIKLRSIKPNRNLKLSHDQYLELVDRIQLAEDLASIESFADAHDD